MRQDLKLRILESLHVEALENSQFEILPHLVAPEWLAVPSPGFPRQISGSAQNQRFDEEIHRHADTQLLRRLVDRHVEAFLKLRIRQRFAP